MSWCLWGGPETAACWHVSACGCRVVKPSPRAIRPSWWERLLLAVMQGPVRVLRRR